MISRLSLAERASYGFGDFGYSLYYNKPVADVVARLRAKRAAA